MSFITLFSLPQLALSFPFPIRSVS